MVDIHAWEVRIKEQLNRLTLSEPWQTIVDREVAQNGLQLLPISFFHTNHVHRLQPLHQDPFDRMLMAQSLAEEMFLVSGNSWIRSYPEIRVFWS